ncbi:MAG: DUF2161 family putative PD-(D/E)XK-type phosphodiesterase [Clostridiales bacterium]|jgi:hypothetical protein|nr:DUF2161 family putative PD-(D/E)XK-type phosphodiesterase [Clostridiales bacterium]
MDFKESDMYAPIKAFFEGLGYEVKGEVRGMDAALLKDGILSAVEMKKSFNMSLIYQALRRQGAASAVFVAIPRAVFMRKRGPILHICERLNLGLITVAMDSPMRLVEAHILPNMPKGRNTKASRAVLAEFNGRNFGDNIGGTGGVKLITAHKERSLQIACALERAQNAAPAALVRDFVCHESAGQILRINTYGWFEKVDRGIYALSEAGRDALKNPAFAHIVDFYKSQK